MQGLIPHQNDAQNVVMVAFPSFISHKCVCAGQWAWVGVERATSAGP
jgi:hypothetical protein